MTDTSPEIAELVRQKPMACSGQERFLMGGQMLKAPEPHFTLPRVAFLDAEVKPLLARLPHEKDFPKRAGKPAKAVEQIKGKFRVSQTPPVHYPNNQHAEASHSG